MSTRMTKAASVDAYIRSFPPSTQTLLNQIRKTIRTAAPDAEEVISYGIAGYKQNGMLIFFAGFANHIGARRVALHLPLTNVNHPEDLQ